MVNSNQFKSSINQVAATVSSTVIGKVVVIASAVLAVFAISQLVRTPSLNGSLADPTVSGTVEALQMTDNSLAEDAASVPISLDGSTPTSANESNQSSTESNTTVQSSEMQVVVNGESVPVPKNGSVQKSVPAGDDNQTSINITVQNTGTGSGSSMSSSSYYSSNNSTSVQIYSDSSSTGTDGGEGGRYSRHR